MLIYFPSLKVSFRVRLFARYCAMLGLFGIDSSSLRFLADLNAQCNGMVNRPIFPRRMVDTVMTSNF